MLINLKIWVGERQVTDSYKIWLISAFMQNEDKGPLRALWKELQNHHWKTQWTNLRIAASTGRGSAESSIWMSTETSGDLKYWSNVGPVISWKANTKWLSGERPTLRINCWGCSWNWARQDNKGMGKKRSKGREVEEADITK